jgi:hypothetical protein
MKVERLRVAAQRRNGLPDEPHRGPNSLIL